MNRVPFLLIIAFFFVSRFIFGHSIDLYLIPLFALFIKRTELAEDYELLFVLVITSFLFSQSLILPIFCTFVVIGIYDLVKHLFHKNEILFYVSGFAALLIFKTLEVSLWGLKINGTLATPDINSVLIPSITGTIGGIILLVILRRYEHKTIKAGNI